MRVRPLTDEEADRIRDLVPERGDVDVDERDGEVVLVADKELGPVASRLRRLLGGSETVRYRLDEHGRAVWRRIDGERTVGEIADAVADQLGGDATLARVWAFVDMLEGKDAVRLKAP